MRTAGKVLWWAGPWIGLAFFAWRQQGLEARLASWVGATNDAIAAGLGKLTDAAAEAAGETEAGRVHD